MATSRLYPTLSKFYGCSNVGDEIHSIDRLLSQNKPQRQDHTSLKPKDKHFNSHLHHINNNGKLETGRLYPRLTHSILDITDNQSPQEEAASKEEPIVPSAPPIELWDEELLRFLEEALLEQQLHSSLDDTPTADYSSITIPPGLLLDESWVDDLQPDYDIPQENSETSYLNNLNKSDRKHAECEYVNIGKRDGCPVELNIRPESRRLVGSEKRDMPRKCRVHESTGMSRGMLVKSQARDQRQQALGKENRLDVMGGHGVSRPSPGSPEYLAWMTWRKQVNRQLATVILLRQGGRVWLQKSDMSRKHLNQRSIDFVSKVVKSGNKTSLGGKPFVMYGIPRASLSGSQRELTNIGRQ